MPVFNLLEKWYKTLIEPMFKGSFPFIKRSTPYLIRPLYIGKITYMVVPFNTTLLSSVRFGAIKLVCAKIF